MSEFSLDDPSFYEDFLVEAQEHFELIEQNFLTLEEAPGDLGILNAICRQCPTIKGASGFLGLAKVQSLSHIGENILDDLRKGRMTVSPDVMELLFETVDVLKVLVGDVGINLRKQGSPKDPEIADLIRRLEGIRDGGTAPKAAPTAQAPVKAPGGLSCPPDWKRWTPMPGRPSRMGSAAAAVSSRCASNCFLRSWAPLSIPCP